MTEQNLPKEILITTANLILSPKTTTQELITNLNLIPNYPYHSESALCQKQLSAPLQIPSLNGGSLKLPMGLSNGQFNLLSIGKTSEKNLNLPV